MFEHVGDTVVIRGFGGHGDETVDQGTFDLCKGHGEVGAW